MRPLRLSADAQTDLEGIWLFVAQDSIAAADAGELLDVVGILHGARDVPRVLDDRDL